ncbi:TetR/AcrR family transcriptional regulator [Nonomuraea sp. NPDC048882]|uniref:TetR/AcrR family transcriptional regulator n=1 Tax=unclassified Nonomuraea TaxID=2593643 RepID=UPI000AD3E797
MEETRRARKKRQTRELLVRTAFRLFKEQGYEQTTIAQISAEADIATKTFFNYFSSKEDVVFTDAERYYELTLDVIKGRRPGERVADLLLRTCELSLSAGYMAEGPISADPELTDVYRNLVATVPSVQAKGLHVMFDSQRRIADAFVAAFPGEIDRLTALAAVGALMGAVGAIGLVSLEMGQSEEEFLATMRRAVDLVMHGLDTL